MINNNDNNNPDGIFVLNGQIFSVNDLINVMRRHGMRIRLTGNGLSVDGEEISSITNLDDNRCPLAGQCDKRIALIDFLKLQRSQDTRQDHFQDYRPANDSQMFSSSQIQKPHTEAYREEPSRDFIKPNNHDLFEGNVSRNTGLFDEPQQHQPQEEMRGLFDEPSFQSESEDSFFNRTEYSEQELPRDNQFGSRDSRPEPRDMNQHFCNRCGYDINPTWNSCPKCGQRVSTQNSQRSEPDYLF
ncbi:MAG: zinc ribbon domain-containing protein [Candidatus Heimdallarchaeota archaeon]